MITNDTIYRAVYDAVRKVNVILAPDVKEKIESAVERETGPGKTVVGRILENLEIAEKTNLPICQDTGMVLVFLEIGEELCPAGIKQSVSDAIADAYRDGFFRKSVVGDPLADRVNTGTNLPAIFYTDLVPGKGVKISLMTKGFGSENTSRLFMLKPTAGPDAVIDAICETMRIARGAPCPPVVLGVGIGGTSDYAAVLSKKALLRALDSPHPDPYYAKLEEDALNAVNKLGIGSGGFGGTVTALAVKIEKYPTHIAGLPVAVTVNCWADRKAEIILEDEG